MIWGGLYHDWGRNAVKKRAYLKRSLSVGACLGYGPLPRGTNLFGSGTLIGGNQGVKGERTLDTTTVQQPIELKTQWVHIMLALSGRRLRVLEIMKEVLNESEGRMHLWQGALYASLHTLEKNGLVEQMEPTEQQVKAGRRARYFQLTDLGASALTAELVRLERLILIGREKGVA